MRAYELEAWPWLGGPRFTFSEIREEFFRCRGSDCFELWMTDFECRWVGFEMASPDYFEVLRHTRTLYPLRQWWIVRLSDGVVLAQNRAEEAR